MAGRARWRARRDVGPAAIAALVAGNVVLWAVARPAGEPGGRHLGQLLGATGLVLLAISLVLISSLPTLETWFDGIDRAAIWHRRVAIAGVLLLIPHIALSSSPEGTALGGPLGAIGAIGLFGLAAWAILPRWPMLLPARLHAPIRAARELPGVREVWRLAGGYERWRLLHQTTGLFVAAGFLHGVLDATAFDAAPLLRWTYIVAGVVGLAFYVYRELVARHLLPHHDYQVAHVERLAPDLVEVALAPRGRPLSFVPGQFAIVYIESKVGWRRHPFTLASAPHDPLVRVTVKALGDYTSRLHELIEPGMPAVIGGPHGRFDRRRGTSRQLWIAGGVGIAPFLSWLRALDGDLDDAVDLFVSSDGPSPFADEIVAIAARHPSLRAHLVDTRVDGRLDPQRALELAGGDAHELSVFMCGPEGMLRTFERALRAAGVPRGQITREHFSWR